MCWVSSSRCLSWWWHLRPVGWSELSCPVATLSRRNTDEVGYEQQRQHKTPLNSSCRFTGFMLLSIGIMYNSSNFLFCLRGHLRLQRVLETIPSTPCGRAPVLCLQYMFVCVCPHPGPCLRPLVSGSTVCPCTQHPAASPSLASLCRSLGSSPSPLERFRSLDSHSAASTEGQF